TIVPLKRERIFSRSRLLLPAISTIAFLRPGLDIIASRWPALSRNAASLAASQTALARFRQTNINPTPKKLFLFLALRLFFLRHLLGQAGRILRVLIAIDRESSQHVIRFGPIPVLLRIVVGHLCRLALRVLMVNGIGARRIGDSRRAAETTFDQMAGKRGDVADGNDVIFTFDFTRDWS